MRDRFPNARFSLIGAPETIGDGFRAFWRYGPPEKPETVTGMDFVVWDGERAKVLYAFVNPRSRERSARAIDVAEGVVEASQ